jgi:hypothetical protein
MKRDGCVCVIACTKSLKSCPDHFKPNYNVNLCTNKTIKYPYAHRGKGRSHCSMCSHPENSGRYKRKQFKHTFNNFLKSGEINF